MSPEKDLVLVEPLAQDVGQLQGIADKVFQVHVLRGQRLGKGLARPALVPVHQHKVLLQISMDVVPTGPRR